MKCSKLKCLATRFKFSDKGTLESIKKISEQLKICKQCESKSIVNGTITKLTKILEKARKNYLK